MKNKNTNAALITGGAKRIGAEIAKLLAANNYDILIHYNHSKIDAESLAKEIKRNYCVNCEIIHADFSKDSAKTAAKIIKESFAIFPNLNLLINNAAIFAPSEIKNCSENLLDELFTTNFKSPFFLIQNFSKKCSMSSKVINLLDAYIETNVFKNAVYLLSKKALYNLTEIAKNEFSNKIKFYEILPKLVLPNSVEEEKLFKKIAEKNPEKIGKISDILNSIKDIISSD